MKKLKINEEELDFLKELINIGSGNAPAALEQLLNTSVVMEVPGVRIIKPAELSSLIGSLDKPVLGVKMSLVGDIKGDIFLIADDENKKALKDLAEKAAPGYGKIEPGSDMSAFEEISNIIVGVFTYSIHDFCGLNVYHTVQDSRTDVLMSLLDESIAARARGNTEFILIETLFQVDAKLKRNITVCLLLILAVDSLEVFAGSIKKVREKMLA